MWTGPSRAAVIAAVVTGGLAAAGVTAVAAGAPVAASPPVISGSPSFGATLTCNPGSWSADAVGFDYAWAYADGGPVFATGRTWRVDDARLSYTIVCAVTARAGQGASTTELSSAVVPRKAATTVRITAVDQRHGSLTVTGTAGPIDALARRFGYAPSVVLSRKLQDFAHLQPIAATATVSRHGVFTVIGRDLPGRHTYVVTFTPPAGDPFSVSVGIRTLTLTR